MPTAVDKLSASSGEPQTKAAISDCIATEMNKGRSQEQAIAMCHAMAGKKTGKDLSKPKGA